MLGSTVVKCLDWVVQDLTIWRYAGPISLIIVLFCPAAYMTRQGTSLSRIGVVRLKTARSYWLLSVQTIFAFVLILATGVVVSLIGEASGLAFMEPNYDGATARFGDVAGNTSVFLFWVAILWVAGPAEELFFRGFKIKTLTDVFGKSRIATVFSVLVPALIFRAGHMYYMGVRGLVTWGMIGLVLGCLLLAYKRNLWPLMIAHASVNSLLFMLQYLGVDA